jgi:hypothetical protein
VRKEALSQWRAAQGIEGKWLENELEDAWRFMTASPVFFDDFEASKLLTTTGTSQTKKDSVELSASLARHIAAAWEAHNGHPARRGIDSQFLGGNISGSLLPYRGDLQVTSPYNTGASRPIWIVSGSRAADPIIDNQSPPNPSPRLVCTITGSQENGAYKSQLWKDLEIFCWPGSAGEPRMPVSVESVLWN